VSGRVNEIQDIIASFELIFHLDGMALDGYASFPFQIHIIQNLILKIPFCQGMCNLNQAVSQGTFSMVNVCNDAEISDPVHLQVIRC